MWKTFSGTQSMGPVASPNTSGPGMGAPGGWHPTILYMLFLVVAEIFFVGLLTRTVLR